MTHQLEQVKRHFYQPAGLDDQQLVKILESMLGHKVDNAELYFQSIRHESWGLEDGIVKEASYNADRGVGVRALAGEKTGFAYSEEIMLPALERASGAAKSIAQSGSIARVNAWNSPVVTSLYDDTDPLISINEEQKISLLKQLDETARAEDPRVKQVMASLSGVYEQVLVVASDGTLAADIRPLVRVSVSVIAEQNGRRERGSAGGGGRYDFTSFVTDDLTGYAKEAVRQALVNLEAIDAPAGVMPVVLGAGWPGVLLHEAVGHGLEGDFNRKGSSAFSGRVGERVASPLVTVVDDGTISKSRGSLSIDDEGTPTQHTTLIEDGVLRGYMQDKRNARFMGQQSTGNGRRESYAHLPMPRMTNTYMLAGKDQPSDIIKSVKKGIYAPNFGGGQVDITSGKFVFSTSEAYLIEDGVITAPVKGATLIGNGPEVMKKVSMVGNDLKLDPGVGICGKEGQSLPVGVGQPTLKVDELTVGGTQ
ncbi:metalloprotease TldD [Pleionea mediterranea]|uniref:Microcin-processing peptidase 2 n=1 Tax=Pleionea mediterranea TaxID=523701 RepID=A0A316FHS1_9GAMM|nr:metalloprotease TldD [Pleionea mediterranea]PWK47813.1 microcin-processing peptidase 2 [Pleionea mediterranea]